MYNWAVVAEDEIIEYHWGVPTNWRHISNLAASQNDLEFMKSVGWFPVIQQSVDFDSSTQEIYDFDYVIDQDHITALPKLRDRIINDDAVSTQPAPVDLDYLQAQLDIYRQSVDPVFVADLARHVMIHDPAVLAELKAKITEFVGQHLTMSPTENLSDFVKSLVQKLTDDIYDQIRIAVDKRGVADWNDRWSDYFQRETARLSNMNDIIAEQRRNIALRDIETLRDQVKEWAHFICPWIKAQDSLDMIRKQRNRFLADSDWTQMSDVQASMTQEQRDKWLAYRQALRDVPQHYIETGILKWPGT